MEMIWSKDSAQSQMVSLYIGDVYYGTWNAKWAKYIQSKLTSEYTLLYRNNLKNREVGKEDPPKTGSSDCFGVPSSEGGNPDPEITGILRHFEEELGWREALNLLARRARFSSEIKQRLQEAGCSLSSMDTVLAKCRRSGYVDDEERARRLVEVWGQKGYGPLRIRMELKKYGVNVPPPLEQEEAKSPHSSFIIRYIEKHLPSLATREQKAKVIRALLRRGFTMDSIYAALAQK